MQQRVIGLIGPIASGKDTVAEYLHDRYGLAVRQVSDELRRIADDRAIAASRPNLTELGTALSQEFSDYYLVERIMRSAPDPVILTGMRQLGQIAWLRQHCQLLLIAIDAPTALRFSRAMERGRLGEATTLDQFVQAEVDENAPPHSQRVFECMKLADYHLFSHGDSRPVRAEVDQILQQHLFVG